MSNEDLFPDETAHLREINSRLEDALAKAEDDVNRIDTDYRNAKRYMSEYRGEIDPHEMFQNELLLKQTDQSGAFVMGIYNQMVKLKDSPYFARIDFQIDGSEKPATFYIGRFTFNYQNELLIHDWRAPISSVFYDYEIGSAGYDAPIGRIDGALTRKRQFKIKNGRMEYVLENSTHIQDDILQKELAQTSSEKMKSIIATIQKEQNQIIRDEKTETMIIQGVAGSGKTSIALHRIAFLLYRFRERLNARNVTILSPNKVFEDYISSVIPELGEEPIYELSFSDIANMELEHVIDFEQDKDPLEIQDEKWKERVCFKSTLNFVTLLESYVTNLPDRVFAPKDYTFGGFTAVAKWIQKRFLTYGNYPIKRRLPMVADDIYHRFQDDNIRDDELPKPRTILKSLTAMLRTKNTLALYKDFYKSIGKPQMLVMSARKTLEWSDVFPFLYLYDAFEGAKTSTLTKHLVIDEMQDYTPIQYAVMNRLFPCPKTILGDFGQSLNPYDSHTLVDIRTLYTGAKFIALNKSYRSTYEIMNFAKHIRNVHSLEAVARHGETPALIPCGHEQEEIERIKEIIQDFHSGNNASLGIILKTNNAAKSLYDLLVNECGIHLISPDSTHFTGGVSVTSVRMAKGLEFDEVIIPRADKQTYCSDYDRSLLYIACTRAMHRLTLLYTAQPSPFIT